MASRPAIEPCEEAGMRRRIRSGGAIAGLALAAAAMLAVAACGGVEASAPTVTYYYIPG